MVNNPLPDDLRKSFDDIIVLINKMIEEAARVKEQYGASSKLYKEKIAAVETTSRLYKLSTAYIERMVRMNIEIGAAGIALDVCLAQKEYNLKFGDACLVLGYKFSAEHIKKVEFFDELIATLGPLSNG